MNGPPKEMTVYLSNVMAPRLGKRPTDTEPGKEDEVRNLLFQIQEKLYDTTPHRHGKISG